VTPEFALGSRTLPIGLRTVLYGGPRNPVAAVALRIAILFDALAVPALRVHRFVMADGSLPCLPCDAGRLIGVSHSALQTEIPLLRDYATLYHLVMIATVSVLGGYLLRRLRTLVPDLQASGAIAGPLTPRVLQLIERANRRLQRRWIHLLILFAAFASSTIGILNYQSGGIYIAFLGGNRQLSISAANDWWASGHGWGFLAFVIVGGIGNYVNYWILYAVAESAQVMFRARRDLELRIDLNNGDGYWGWASARSAVRLGSQVFVATAVGLAAVILIGGVISTQYLFVFPLALGLSTVPFFVANRVYRTPIEKRSPVRAPSSVVENEIQAILFRLAPERLIGISGIVFQAAFVILPGLIVLVGELKNET
jgi:hypothetical protein